MHRWNINSQLLKNMIPSLKANSAAVAASVILLFAIGARAAFVPLPSDTQEIPGVNLSGTSGLTGTVIADQTVAFTLAMNPYNSGSGNTSPVPICFRNSDAIVPFYLVMRFAAAGATAGPCPPIDPILARTPINLEGTLRSLIVDRGGLRDYYYQITNTSSIPAGMGADIFRLTIGGFLESETLSVSYSLDGLAGLTGAGAWVNGTKAPYSADRISATPGNVGFDFDMAHFLNTNIGGPSDAPGNVDSGEMSYFIVVRTEQIAASVGMSPADLAFDELAQSAAGQAVIVGAGAAVASAFGPDPVPEPATVLLAGWGMLVAAGSRTRRR